MNDHIRVHTEIDHVYTTGEDTTFKLEKPFYTRQECIRRGVHGGYSSIIGALAICGGCNTRVTAEDLDRRRTPPTPIEFEHWLSHTTQHYVVPPANTIRVCVSEHRANAYVTIEDLLATGEISEGQVVRQWKHRPGSSTGHGNIIAARAYAKELWGQLVKGERPER